MRDIQEIWRHWNYQADFKATLPGIFKDLRDKIVQFQRKLGKNQVGVCWAFLPISGEEGGEEGEREKQEEKSGRGARNSLKCGICNTDVSIWQYCFIWKRKSRRTFLLLFPGCHGEETLVSSISECHRPSMSHACSEELSCFSPYQDLNQHWQIMSVFKVWQAPRP